MTKTISDYKVHKFREESQRQQFMDHVTEFMKENANNPRGNISLTEVDLLLDEDESEEDLKFIVVRKEIRPGRIDPTWEAKMVPAEEAKRLEQVIPELRSKHLPPVNVEVIEKHRYPETDISSSYDHVVFSPKATVFLEELERRGVPVPNFDTIEYDVEATRNRPVKGLREGTQKGIEDTKKQKISVLDAKNEFENKVCEAIQQTLGGADTEHLRGRSTSAKTIKPDGLFEYYKRIVHKQGGKEPQILHEQNCDLSSLEEMKKQIDQGVDQTERHSVQAFKETIDEGGMELPPNSVDGADDAIERVGIGRRKFLRLD